MALTGSPAWGEVADYPWTTGALVPYPVEAKVYAAQLQEQFPDGATVALFTVNSEFGDFYVDAFNEVAADYGLEVVDEQTIEATDEAPPTSQLNSIADKAPDAILAVPLGGQCPTFLSELANAKAANPGWDPKVYITSTCASALILGSAGDAADGVYTAQDLKDVNDPAVQSEPGVAEYVQFMNDRGSSGEVTTGTQGWVTAELMVAILKQAAESPDGLTRASIIEAARNFEYTSALSRDGVVYKMSGEEDPFLTESMQVIQYDVATQTWAPIGELITQFES
jgi:ABC-type branched-subunit amino acid transport system substrate-binding protein